MDGDLSNAHEWLGYFWPAGRQEQQARAGNLSYNPETGLDLELLNAFDDRGVVPIVHGTIDRLPVTLLECAVLSTSLRAFEQVAVQQSLRPQMLLCGIHLEDAQTGCFEAVDVEIENLTEWSAFTDDIQLTYELDDRAPGATEEAQTGQPEAGRSGPLRRMRRLFSRPLQLRSGTDRAIFVGDLLHSPLQIPHPEQSPCFDEDTAQAARVRIALLEIIADTNTLMLPAHFPGAGAAEITRHGASFAVKEWASW